MVREERKRIIRVRVILQADTSLQPEHCALVIATIILIFRMEYDVPTTCLSCVMSISLWPIIYDFFSLLFPEHLWLYSSTTEVSIGR